VYLLSSLAEAHNQLLNKEHAEESATDDEIGQRICDVVWCQQSLLQDKPHLSSGCITRPHIHTHTHTHSFTSCTFYDIVLGQSTSSLLKRLRAFVFIKRVDQVQQQSSRSGAVEVNTWSVILNYLPVLSLSV